MFSGQINAKCSNSGEDLFFREHLFPGQKASVDLCFAFPILALPVFPPPVPAPPGLRRLKMQHFYLFSTLIAFSLHDNIKYNHKLTICIKQPLYSY